MRGFLELQVDAHTEAWGGWSPKSMNTGAPVLKSLSVPPLTYFFTQLLIFILHNKLQLQV